MFGFFFITPLKTTNIFQLPHLFLFRPHPVKNNDLSLSGCKKFQMNRNAHYSELESFYRVLYRFACLLHPQQLYRQDMQQNCLYGQTRKKSFDAYNKKKSFCLVDCINCLYYLSRNPFDEIGNVDFSINANEETVCIFNC